MREIPWEDLEKTSKTQSAGPGAAKTLLGAKPWHCSGVLEDAGNRDTDLQPPSEPSWRTVGQTLRNPEARPTAPQRGNTALHLRRDMVTE